ncbi:MAG: YbaK/EbsC family protein [Actinomycetales bacterium]|nr:YbaK/EbsC family protein [Actinomycetales bacterium]
MPSDAAPSGLDRVTTHAAELGLAIEVVERAAAGSLEEAAAILGISPADIVKSLVVKHKDGSYLFALVPGDRQISWPKLRALVGVNKLSLPDADAALAATGYARGTITPLGALGPGGAPAGSGEGWPVYADERIRARRVSMGAGEHGRSLFVDGDELLESLGAVVADLTEPLPER